MKFIYKSFTELKCGLIYLYEDLDSHAFKLVTQMVLGYGICIKTLKQNLKHRR